MAKDQKTPVKLQQSVLRFAAVGVVNTIVDIGIFTVLQSSHVSVLVANTISTSVGLLISFSLNRRYTFQAHGSALQRQLIRFFPVTLIGLWILQPVVILGVKHGFNSLLQASIWPAILHVPIIVPKLAATVVSLIWNYYWYSRYVFKQD